MSEAGDHQTQPQQPQGKRKDSNASDDSHSDIELEITWSQRWAKARAEYLNKEGAKSAFYAFMSLLVFLAVAGSLGTAVYVGALLIGPIAAGLAAALPLGVPAVALTIIGAGILIASVAALLRFVQIHWEMHHTISKIEADEDLSYKAAAQKMAATPLRYAFMLFMAAFVIGFNTADAIDLYDAEGPLARDPKTGHFRDEDADLVLSSTKGSAFKKLWHFIFDNKYHAAAIVAALGLGIALAVPVVPYIMATVMASFGLPYGVAVLFGAVAAATIIAVTYQLLASATTLYNLYELAKSYREGGIKHEKPFPYFYVAAAVIGVAVAAAAAYLFFVPLANVLTPVLASSSLATFLAIATSVSLAVALRNFVPAVVVGGPAFMKAKFYEGSTLQRWWNADERAWAKWSWGKEKGAAGIELHSSSASMPSTTLLPSSADVPDNRWFFQRWWSPKQAVLRDNQGQPSSSDDSRSTITSV